jgi:hypothetical protein
MNEMKKEQTELLDFTVNPTFLELMKQPISSIKISNFFSFDMERNGRMLHCTIYSGKDGQVNISDINKNGMHGNTILRDFCQTPEDFKKMLEKLDDLLTRMPVWD